MDQKERIEFNKLRTDLRRLEQIVGLLLRRVNVLEKTNRSLKARMHQTGADVATIDRNVNTIERSTRRGGPYNPSEGL